MVTMDLPKIDAVFLPLFFKDDNKNSLPGKTRKWAFDFKSENYRLKRLLFYFFFEGVMNKKQIGQSFIKTSRRCYQTFLWYRLSLALRKTSDSVSPYTVAFRFFLVSIWFYWYYWNKQMNKILWSTQRCLFNLFDFHCELLLTDRLNICRYATF